MILENYHGIDHPGQRESKRRVTSMYFWPNIKKDMNTFVKNCHACQSTKPSKMPNPHIGHFPVPEKRFSHIHIDVCGPLPPSRGFKYLLMVVDRCTRYVDAIPMAEATTEACANALLHSWVSRHGVASACTSDNGVEFVSKVWKIMQAKLGVQLNYTPLYSPQSNGLVERQNSTLKTSLKAALVKMGEEYKDKWYDFLPWILLMKRVAFQKELGTSPSILTYGMNPAIPGDLLRDPGQELTPPDLQELVKYMLKTNNNAPNPTKIPNQIEVPEPPHDITHVYAKQHKAQGLQASYEGPFRVVSRPSRSQAKIQVGLTVAGEPRYEVRSWRDLKVAHVEADTIEAQRPKRGRPKKLVTIDQSEPASSVSKPETQGDSDVNKPASSTTNDAQNSKVGGKRPARTTRNPNPSYVDSITNTGPPPALAFPGRPLQSVKPWSASVNEIMELNRQIQAKAA